MREKLEDYTDKVAKEEILGAVSPEQQEYAKQLEGENITLDQAFDLAKNSKNSDEKLFPHDVHGTLLDLLSIENYNQVRFYTAVGSCLQEKYGVDAFFELDLGDGELVMATLNISQSFKKEYKADVEFQWPDEGIIREDPDERAIWDQLVNEVAKEVKDVLVSTANAHGKTISSLSEKKIEKSFKIAEEARKERLKKLSLVEAKSS